MPGEMMSLSDSRARNWPRHRGLFGLPAGGDAQVLFGLRQHLLDLGLLRALRICFQKSLPSGDRGLRVGFALPLEVAEIEEHLRVFGIDSQGPVERGDATV